MEPRLAAQGAKGHAAERHIAERIVALARNEYARIGVPAGALDSITTNVRSFEGWRAEGLPKGSLTSAYYSKAYASLDIDARRIGEFLNERDARRKLLLRADLAVAVARGLSHVAIDASGIGKLPGTRIRGRSLRRAVYMANEALSTFCGNVVGERICSSLGDSDGTTRELVRLMMSQGSVAITARNSLLSRSRPSRRHAMDEIGHHIGDAAYLVAAKGEATTAGIREMLNAEDLVEPLRQLARAASEYGRTDPEVAKAFNRLVRGTGIRIETGKELAGALRK
ncbi:MAG: hypothetical protein KGH69_04905 [Candidatus Micrarchaeota archaeon]|nr:hypothetical protein [Candidatus Micrarchaeota archaeon]